MRGDTGTAKRKLELLREHPAIAITLAVAALNAIGIVASFFSLIFYGVNFFDFAEIDDFIIGAFRNPAVFMYGIGALVLFRVVMTKFPKLPRSVVAATYAIGAILVIPALFGMWDARNPGFWAIFSNKYTEVIYSNGNKNEPTTTMFDVRIISNPGDFLIFTNEDGDVFIIRRSTIIRIHERN